MLIYMLTGWVCSVALRCAHPIYSFPEVYQTKEECELRAEQIRHNTKFVLSAELWCEPHTIEVPQS
jgi:hypothetical protein